MSSPSTDNHGYDVRTPVLTTSEATEAILERLVRNAAAQDLSPEMRERLDTAFAARISGSPRVKHVAPFNKDNPSAPIYLESAAGHGKTAAFKQAAKIFCEGMGLEFVEDPPPSFARELDPDKHFVFFTIDMAGATSTLDIGNVPTRVSLDNGEPQNSSSYPDPAVIKGMLQSSLATSASYAGPDGNPLFKLESLESLKSGPAHLHRVTLKGDADGIEDALEVAKRQLRGAFKETGHDLSEDSTQNAACTYLCKKVAADTYELTVSQPALYASNDQEASAVLANYRFPLMERSKFGTCVFDDISTANAYLRNIILRVAQSGGVPSVATVGKGIITGFTGNLGGMDGAINVASKQSIPEVTRQTKYIVRATPQEWAALMRAKYEGAPGSENLPGPDAQTGFMMSFALKNDQMFKPLLGAEAKGSHPVPNPRSLENGLSLVAVRMRELSNAAVENGDAPLEYVGETLPRIIRDLQGTIGIEASDKYKAHLEGMLQEAVPAATRLVTNAQALDPTKKQWLAELQVPQNYIQNGGDFTDGRQKDFGFQIVNALSDQLVMAFNQSQRVDPGLLNAAEVARKQLNETTVKMVAMIGALCANKPPQNAHPLPADMGDILLNETGNILRKYSSSTSVAANVIDTDLFQSVAKGLDATLEIPGMMTNLGSKGKVNQNSAYARILSAISGRDIQLGDLLATENIRKADTAKTNAMAPAP